MAGMRHLRRASPSPALIVASLALIAAVTGAAIASPVAKKPVTKKKVKKIARKQADKEINALAPGLSVASAQSASNATNAQTAQDLPNLKFTNLTLKNGWVSLPSASGAAQYAVDAQGVVHLRGGITRSSGTSLNPFRVPEAIRPSLDQFMAIGLYNAETGRLRIASDGEAFVADDTAGSSNAVVQSFLGGVTYAVP
jgi:hypothetical protein